MHLIKLQDYTETSSFKPSRNRLQEIEISSYFAWNKKNKKIFYHNESDVTHSGWIAYKITTMLVIKKMLNNLFNFGI